VEEMLDSLVMSDWPPADGPRLRRLSVGEALRGAVRAAPPESYPPQVWLLGSGEFSATLAAELGFPMAVAHHIWPGSTQSALDVYRRHFKPSRWLVP
jgi:alkanesulfonate monooxygenase SsuD/methylene tetrahydromethanopterin reductase-like flavin-dependent oxidoreductase (luciferase family)